MSLTQILAISIFVLMFLLVVSERLPRHYVTLGSGALMMIIVFGFCMRSSEAFLTTLNFQAFIEPNFWIAIGEHEEATAGINWATIVFIFGMMVMVEGMAKAGFFRWLCLGIAKLVKYKTSAIFLTFMLMSFVLAMFIDSITVILFLAAVTIELAKLLKFSPVPMIIAEIFCANLGGAATMCGDPPNIIIGTSLGYTFTDFLLNTGLIAVVALVFEIIYFMLVFRKDLKKKGDTKGVVYPEPKEAIKSRKHFFISCVIFAIAVALLITHSITGLTVATIGLFVAILTLAVQGKGALALLKKVDYETIFFFIGLFVVVGGLEQTGVLEIIAAYIEKISGGNVLVMVAIVLWVSAIASAFVDNIPFAATMIPVIKALSMTMGVDLASLSWVLAIGTDIGGSSTPIGASANVVGISAAAKSGHLIGWGKYCKYSVPATVIAMVVGMAIIYVRYF